MEKIKLKKPFLIGEIGINHNGSIHLAKKLIDMANSRGGHDNITVIIARMAEGENYGVADVRKNSKIFQIFNFGIIRKGKDI